MCAWSPHIKWKVLGDSWLIHGHVTYHVVPMPSFISYLSDVESSAVNRCAAMVECLAPSTTYIHELDCGGAPILIDYKHVLLRWLFMGLAKCTGVVRDMMVRHAQSDSWSYLSDMSFRCHRVWFWMLLHRCIHTNILYVRSTVSEICRLACLDSSMI